MYRAQGILENRLYMVQYLFELHVKPTLNQMLTDILGAYLNNKKDPVCVEMFSRCLYPGWISWGNECLKFQHLSFFEKEESK